MEPIVERGTPQLNVQELGQEQQLTLHEHETHEPFSEHKGGTQGALSELEEETQEARSEHEREQQLKEGEAEPASGSANLEGPALPALLKLTIEGNIPPILSSRTGSRRPHTDVEGEALHCFLPAIEAEEEIGVEDALACDNGGQMAMQATLDIPEPRNRRQAMESQKWDIVTTKAERVAWLRHKHIKSVILLVCVRHDTPHTKGLHSYVALPFFYIVHSVE